MSAICTIGPVLTLEEYQALHGERFNGVSEGDIKRWYELDTTFASFAVNVWQEKRKPHQQDQVVVDPEEESGPQLPLF